jgi:hypothetical protein
MDLNKEFKRCPSCGYEWITREKFIEDPKIDIVGYQVNFVDLEEGFFLFNHACGTSMAVMVGEFKDLYDGPVFSERMADTDECPQYCLFEDNMSRCPAKCECAYVTEIIQIVKNWPKRN